MLKPNLKKSPAEEESCRGGKVQIWMNPNDDIPGRNQTAWLTALRAREIDWPIASADIIVASGRAPRLQVEYMTAPSSLVRSENDLAARAVPHMSQSQIWTPVDSATRSADISTSTTAHQNTPLSMLLKRKDFADWDSIPWGILGSVALVRR
ncbi:hypothetical protein IVA93_39235 (plasmid) [Bradyrhizobium sp. 155]|uniref:hypothetical protein n=1 Tax=Bradyrhizobium sp. 155 TaxID=2782629 RepID=UPI001FFF06F7|nr:hypothetical protein [Bradyrhizobium sp. 155]UPK16082.1 hypothetical protein IVA93_39235 [Bradyrhizobium sp. 155]